MKKSLPNNITLKFILTCIFLAILYPVSIQNIYAMAQDDSIQAYRDKADEAQKKGDLDAAILWYQKALSIDPNHRQIYIDLALLYEKNEEIKKSAFYWMKAYRLSKENDLWAQEARKKLENQGLLDSTEGIPAQEKKETVRRYSNRVNLSQEKPKAIVFGSDKIKNERKEVIEKTLKNIEIELAMEYQIIEGEQVFTVIDSGGQSISKLTYPIKGNIFTLKGELRFDPRFSVGGRYGSSDFDKTVNSDEDWNFTGLHNGSLKHIDYQITKQDCESQMEMFDINLYYRLLNMDNIDTDKENGKFFIIDKFSLDIFGGYQQQKGRYTMKDPMTGYLRVVDNAWWEAVGLPLSQGLNSPYKVLYRGPKVGLRIGGSNKKFSTKVSMSYGWVKTKAHGYWNLRDYSFSQDSTDIGYVLNLDADMRYNLNKNWFVGAGYIYTEYKQEKLTESGVQPGYSYDNLDIIRDVNNKTYGPYLMIGSIW